MISKLWIKNIYSQIWVLTTIALFLFISIILIIPLMLYFSYMSILHKLKSKTSTRNLSLPLSTTKSTMVGGDRLIDYAISFIRVLRYYLILIIISLWVYFSLVWYLFLSMIYWPDAFDVQNDFIIKLISVTMRVKII